MGKQVRKQNQNHKKTGRWQRVCARCGNENYSPRKVFKCQYCGLMNGFSNNLTCGM